MRLPAWLAQHLAALRALLVFTALLGVAYPLTLVAVGRLPGLDAKADGSLLTVDGRSVGSALVGQSFTDADGNPVPRYFQSRPSAAGDGYDPTASAASNLGPESVLDTLAVDPEDSTRSLLSQVCARSLAVGALDGVDGRRPYCTPDGVGAVLAVFRADGLTGPVTRVVSVNQTAPATPFVSSWLGVPVELAQPGEDYRAAGGLVTPVRGAPRSTPPSPPTRSPPAAAASTRTSVRRTPGSRWPGWRGSGAWTRRWSGGWSGSTPPVGRSASWAPPR